MFGQHGHITVLSHPVHVWSLAWPLSFSFPEGPALLGHPYLKLLFSWHLNHPFHDVIISASWENKSGICLAIINEIFMLHEAM